MTKRKEKPLRVEWWVERHDLGPAELWWPMESEEQASELADPLPLIYRAVRVEIYAVPKRKAK